MSVISHNDSKNAWVSDGLNAWDKMKSVGTKKKGKLSAHFGSASHKAALKQFAHFVDPRTHVDVLMDKARRQEMIEIAVEVERNREAIKILLEITGTPGLGLPRFK